MTTYWLTFRIAEQTVGRMTDDQRRQELYDTIQANATSWWTEPTSFILFESEETIDALASVLKMAIAPTHDLVLIRQIDGKSARIMGVLADRDVFAMMPYLRTV